MAREFYIGYDGPWQPYRDPQQAGSPDDVRHLVQLDTPSLAAGQWALMRLPIPSEDEGKHVTAGLFSYINFGGGFSYRMYSGYSEAQQDRERTSGSPTDQVAERLLFDKTFPASPAVAQVVSRDYFVLPFPDSDSHFYIWAKNNGAGPAVGMVRLGVLPLETMPIKANDYWGGNETGPV